MKRIHLLKMSTESTTILSCMSFDSFPCKYDYAPTCLKFLIIQCWIEKIDQIQWLALASSYFFMHIFYCYSQEPHGLYLFWMRGSLFAMLIPFLTSFTAEVFQGLPVSSPMWKFLFHVIWLYMQLFPHLATLIKSLFYRIVLIFKFRGKEKGTRNCTC